MVNYIDDGEVTLKFCLFYSAATIKSVLCPNRANDSVALFTVTFHILFTNLSGVAVFGLYAAGGCRSILNTQQSRTAALSDVGAGIVAAARLGLPPGTVLQLGSVSGAQIARFLWIFAADGVVFGISCGVHRFRDFVSRFRA